MGETTKNRYIPDCAIHPGAILEEYLLSLDMSRLELAKRTGIAIEHIGEIINAKAQITPEIACRLAQVFERPDHFWNNLEKLYKEVTSRLEDGKWLKRVPFKKMAEYGWIKYCWDKSEQLAEVLRFFRVESREQWLIGQQKVAAVYRQSQKVVTHAEAISAWLRQGEIQAQKIQCSPYDESRFKEILADVRQLTTKQPKDFQQQLEKLCAPVGVAVVFVPELPRTGIYGATRWLASDKALIQLSLRYKSDDHLWFTFFHEAGHVLIHGEGDVFLEGGGIMNQEKENQANRYATDILIPLQAWEKFVESRPYSLNAVKTFANGLGIAPGIVVGRLQHEKHVEHSWGNDLKQRFQWDLQ